MDTATHNLNTLFAQLGLDDSDADIETFIQDHAGQLSHSTPLHKAPFWSESQAKFLAESVREDADWAEVVDSLSALLRH